MQVQQCGQARLGQARAVSPVGSWRAKLDGPVVSKSVHLDAPLRSGAPLVRVSTVQLELHGRASVLAVVFSSAPQPNGSVMSLRMSQLHGSEKARCAELLHYSTTVQWAQQLHGKMMT